MTNYNNICSLNQSLPIIPCMALRGGLLCMCVSFFFYTTTPSAQSPAAWGTESENKISANTLNLEHLTSCFTVCPLCWRKGRQKVYELVNYEKPCQDAHDIVEVFELFYAFSKIKAEILSKCITFVYINSNVFREPRLPREWDNSTVDK